MKHEIESYVGELNELREKVKKLEAELAEYRPKVRVSGVPYEVELKPSGYRIIKSEIE